MDIQACRAFLIEKTTKLWAANAAVFKASDAPKTLEDAIQNVTQKLRQIPIGLDYHTISAKPWHPWVAKEGTRSHEGTTPIEQERTLIREIREGMKPFHHRKIRIYSNVMLCPDRFNDRIDAIREIPAELIFSANHFYSSNTNMAKHDRVRIRIVAIRKWNGLSSNMGSIIMWVYPDRAFICIQRIV